MKKTVILSVLLAVIFVLSSVIVVMMATGILDRGKGERVVSYNNMDNEKQYIKCQLVRSDIDILGEHIGIVRYTDDTKMCYQQKQIGGDFQMLVKIGDIVKKGEILYHNNSGEPVFANNDMLVVSLRIDTDMYMETFVYSYSQICLSIPSKYQSILGDIVFSTIDDEGKEIILEYEYISSYVKDGNIDIGLKNVLNVLDNTQINIITKYYTIPDKISIPKQYVFFDNGKPYVHIVDDGEEDYYIDVYEYNEDTYVINDNLDGVTVGYTLEERYMNDGYEEND